MRRQLFSEIAALLCGVLKYIDAARGMAAVPSALTDTFE